MKNVQTVIKNEGQLDKAIQDAKAQNPNLILLFGSDAAFSKDGWAMKFSKAFPGISVLGCSTAGEISNQGVSDNSLVVTSCHFEHPNFTTFSVPVKSMAETREAGLALGKVMKKPDLSGVFMLGRGLDVNGSALIDGLREVVGAHVNITGGLAGDGGKFQRTFTILNGEVFDDRVVALGLHGQELQMSFGSQGGWQPFGPVRKITKSKANVLFELDGQPALEVYKKYLGDKAKELPASGLLFPFALLKDNQDTTGIIRTILAVNEADHSLTLAGDVPENGIVRLMHTSNEGLVAGARGAAEKTWNEVNGVDGEGLGILISCVGRKLVMGDDIEDELDEVKDVFGKSTVTGFYSYGEICPESKKTESKLHNQTMTITYLFEKKKAA